ncbi:MAG: hypothetical protein OEW90_05390 [Betaproteobacteria bacterium]|nr:hypothetical protein [Betaproteobacteria bacterium]MDH4323555.1 hypothetical protein [Betaproteobacteria bacterium]
MAAAVGVQHRFQGKALLGPEPSVRADELEACDFAAREKALDFLEVLAGVAIALGAHAGFRAGGKGGHLGDHGLAQGSAGAGHCALERRGDPGNGAEAPEPRK